MATKELVEDCPFEQGIHRHRWSLASLQMRGALLQSLTTPLVPNESDDEQDYKYDDSISSSAMFAHVNHALGCHDSSRSRLDASGGIHAYDQEYAKMLNGTIGYRKLDLSSASLPVVELAADTTSRYCDHDGDKANAFYLLRVPCRYSETRVLRQMACLAQEYQVVIHQTLLDGTHDHLPDVALFVSGACEEIEEFCLVLEELDFVLAAPTALPVVIV
ncbi:hypothetical protein MPSEU_000834900 [Mayamaea pseudoterrestris]|nr:hypothetical protein MPSEU_000834900 [Mayamaea pseudoterrestris]